MNEMAAGLTLLGVMVTEAAADWLSSRFSLNSSRMADCSASARAWFTCQICRLGNKICKQHVSTTPSNAVVTIFSISVSPPP